MATSTQTARTGKRQWARNLALLAIALLVARFLMLRDQPERLLDLTLGSVRAPNNIVGERMFWETDDRNGSVIHALPVTGGTERQIVHEDAQWEMLLDPFGSLTFTPSSLYYCLRPRPKPAFGVGMGGPAGGSPIVFLGTFRAPAKKASSKPVAQEKRIVVKTSPADPFPVRIRRVSLSGGTPQDVAKIVGSVPTIVGDNAFWIAHRPEVITEFIRGKEMRNEFTGHSDLMVTPLNGGPTRKLASGLSTNTQLYAGTDGVFWTEPHVYPDFRIDLYRCRATDTKPMVIADFKGRLGQSPPVEFQGRLYWFASRADADRKQSYGEKLDCLMTAKADGSDQRLIPSLLDSLHVPISALVSHRGSLYFILADNSQANKPDCLYRLHPGPNGKAEIVRRLPTSIGNLKFVGDYVYFVLTENHRSLFARLTDDPVYAPPTQTLCRIRLPD